VTVSDGGIVTVLFTDVVNSTELLVQLGDERAESRRREHFKVLRDAVADHGGHEVKTMGDGVMVVFPSAVDAVRCAVAIQQSTATKGVDVRVGLHVGEPIRDEGDYFGTPVVVARRLCDAAAGGQILTSDLVQALVGSRSEFAFHDAGFLALKGIAEPVAAWEVGWDAGRTAGLPLPAALAAGERLPFVGRGDLLDELRVQWKKAKDGHRALVMLAGEPGIGKTRLASEFARQVHTDGAQVLFGHADEETLLPYQPFVEAFHHVVRHAPTDDLRAFVGGNGAELGRLLPALHDALPGLSDPMHSEEPDSERFRLFEAATEFTAAIAAVAPVVLVLDDLHWADKPTLLLLHHLFRTPADIGLLVVGTYRDTDLDRRHPLAETLADLRRLVEFERIAVGGLGEAELTQFIDLVAGQSPPPEFARAVLDQTEGNPFFIGEVLRHLVESGALSVVDGEWVPTVELEELGIPEGVKEVIGRRVTRLSEDANAVLAVAAVAGRDFALDVLDRVTEMGENRLLSAIDEAVQARLVVELPGPVARFHFAHALVRETLYDELTTARRVRMHRRIAQTLEELHGQSANPPLAQLAYHWFESASAADARIAVDYSCRAGARAMARLAYEEAVTHFERALEAIDLIEGDPPGRGVVLLDVADARAASGDIHGSRKALDDATALGRRVGDGVVLARAALERAGPFTTGTRDAENVLRLEEALRLLPEDDSSERARVLCRLGMEEYWGGDRTRMEALATEGFEMARRLGDPSALSPALNVAAVLYDSPADTERRLDLMQEAVALAESSRDVSAATMARGLAAWSHLEMGDIAGFEITIEAGAVMVAEARLPSTTWWVPVWQASHALLRGDVVEAERLALESFVLGQAADDVGSLQTFGAQMFVIRRAQGRLEELEANVRGMVTEFPAVPAWRGALALLLAESGRPDDAQAELDILAADNCARIPRDNLWLIALSLISAAAFHVGDAEHAAAAYPLLLPYEHRFVTVGQVFCEGSVARMLGEFAAACGRLDDAVAHFERGIERDRGMSGQRSALYGQAELVTTLIRRNGPGDSARATALGAETIVEANELGLTSITSAMHAQLGQSRTP
jgi:class 3 adenylate cyclase/tetratricopeptide (TPR) repeat protein